MLPFSFHRISLLGLCAIAFADANIAKAYQEVYHVQMELIYTAPNGKEVRVSCQPSFVVELGTPTVYDTRFKLGMLKDGEERDTVRSGHFVLINISHREKDKRLVLDLTAQIGDSQPANSDALRITMVGLRVIEPVQLGRIITVPLRNGQGRWEILVDRPKRRGVPLPPETGKRSGQ